MKYRLRTLLILPICLSISFGITGGVFGHLHGFGASVFNHYIHASTLEGAVEGGILGAAIGVIMSCLANHGFRFTIRGALLAMLVLGLFTALCMERWRARIWEARAEDARSTLRALGAETTWSGSHGGYRRIERKAKIAGSTPTVFDTANGVPAVEPPANSD